MIVARNAAVSGFRKEKYFIVHLKADGLDAVSGHITDKAEADRIALACQDKGCRIGDSKQKREVVKAPKLYDLTTLQRECNRVFGMTAERTLACAQSLYEKKLATYPRTDSNYLTEDMEDTAGMVIGRILEEMEFAREINYRPNIRRVMDNRKVGDHHAIIPTSEISREAYRKLSQDEQRVLVMVAGKLLAATMADHIYVVTSSKVICEGYEFLTKGKTVTQEGFRFVEEKIRKYFGIRKETDKEPEGSNHGENGIPKMEYERVDAVVSEQFTQPPKRYTEDTLLAAMERAGNEDITEETEKKGIGTPATRAAIIEKIIKSGFVRRERKYLIPTQDGISLITILPEELTSAKMTAEWEMELAHIAQGKGKGEDFIERIEIMVSMLVSCYDGMQPEDPGFTGRNRKNIGKCPKCGKPVYEGKMNFYCSNRECDFALWKRNRYFDTVGADLDERAAREFLANGRCRYEGLVSKRNGKTYTADIVMDVPEKGYVRFTMEFPQKEEKK